MSSMFAGMKVSVLVPSLAGGAAAAYAMKGAPVGWRLSAGIVGALCSIFFTDLALFAVLHMAGWFSDVLPANKEFAHAAERAIAFAIGLTGLTICLTLMAAVERVRNRIPAVVDRGLDRLS